MPPSTRLRRLAAFLALSLPAHARATDSSVSAVSTDVDGDPSITANQDSSVRAVSADGRYVALITDATDFLPGQVGPVPGRLQLYLVDTRSGARWMVSHKAGLTTTACNAPTDAAAVSRDGSYVAFVSRCSDLVPGQVDPGIPADNDVFLWSRSSNSAVLVSHAAGVPATVANEPSLLARLSDDGRFVIFASEATDLVSGQVDTGFADVFLFDRTTGESSQVSHSLAGSTTAANGPSTPDGLSADGSWILFSSSAGNLIAGFDDNSGNGGDLFLFERATGAITLVSHVQGDPAATGNGFIYDGTIDAAGELVAFTSLATDYLPGMVDGNGPLSTDVFLWRRSADTVELLSDNAAGSASGNHRSSKALVSRDGEYVTFLSRASDLVAGADTNDEEDAFLVEVGSGATTLVTHAAGLPDDAASAGADEHAIGDSGRFVAFRSRATDLLPGQVANNTHQAFLFDRLAGESTLMSPALGAPTTSSNASAEGVQLAGGTATVSFFSSATNLVAADLNNRIDAFASRVVVFADGFESGNLSQWSSSQP